VQEIKHFQWNSCFSQSDLRYWLSTAEISDSVRFGPPSLWMGIRRTPIPRDNTPDFYPYYVSRPISIYKKKCDSAIIIAFRLAKGEKQIAVWFGIYHTLSWFYVIHRVIGKRTYSWNDLFTRSSPLNVINGFPTFVLDVCLQVSLALGLAHGRNNLFSPFYKRPYLIQSLYTKQKQ
jgi:hypothetical protein